MQGEKYVDIKKWAILFGVAEVLGFIPMVGNLASIIMIVIVRCIIVANMVKRVNEMCADDGQVDGSVGPVLLTIFFPWIYIPIYLYVREKRLQAKSVREGSRINSYPWLAMLTYWLGGLAVTAIWYITYFSSIIGGIIRAGSADDPMEILEALLAGPTDGALLASIIVAVIGCIIYYGPILLFMRHYNMLVDICNGKVIPSAPVQGNESKLEPKVTPSAQKHFIRVLTGAYAGAELPIKDGEKIVIGKDTSQCNLILQAPAVSRRHCEIRYSDMDNAFYVMDMSTNGTYVAMPGQMRRLLTNKDERLDIGSIIYISKNGDQLQLM